MHAMELREGHSIVTIGSGGCNVLAYLSRNPSRIDVVDLNPHHIALNKLKLAAFRHLPAHGDVVRQFGVANVRSNSDGYDRFIAPHLDAQTRAYWSKRTLSGRRRISVFDRNIYRTGLLGRFIGAGHVLAIRWLTKRKSSLFGLGIPPRQYDELASLSDGNTIAPVLRARLEKLACDFPLKDNYFAWQAFARRYPQSQEGALPDYLRQDYYDAIRNNASRVNVHHATFTELLASKPASSVDRYVLLDAQDWMSDAQINELWSQISRTAAADARVIFRTAAERSVIEGRLSPDIRAQWSYLAERSQELNARDRSAIYGGFHIYQRTSA
jgi:S-adenosylmethionine-diacylglycerol 3-amino-3-carboxypropyl transferase